MTEIIESPSGDHPPVIDHADPVPPAVVPPPRRRGGGGAYVFALLLSAALGAAGYYAWTHPNPEAARQIAEAASTAQDAAASAADAKRQEGTLAQQIATLADRVDKLEKTPPPPPAVADLGDLPKRVEDLAARVQALENRPAATGGTAAAPDNSGVQQVQQAVADLNQRVGQALDAEKSTLDSQKQALASQSQDLDSEKQAVAQLSARLDKIEPRLAALEQGVGRAKGSVAESAKLARVEAALVNLQTGKPLGAIPDAPPALARFASVAPPTEAHLREEYPALAEHARKVSQPDLKGRGFWQRALTRLQSAVTVRQGPDVLVGDPAAGILTDAGTKVETGDLAGAVTTLQQLSGPAATAMQGWVQDAQALLAARSALADMAAHS